MKTIDWNTDKSMLLKESRGVSFEDIVFLIERDDVLDDFFHPDQKKYPDQRIMAVRFRDYVYLVPYVVNDDGIFLKTIIPSRKATAKYLGEIT